jgi:hypothetical protein
VIAENLTFVPLRQIHIIARAQVCVFGGKVLSFPNRILSLASSSRVELAEKGEDWGTNTWASCMFRFFLLQ